MNVSISDRRRYPRFELNLEARYKILDYGETFKIAKTRNVSMEGMCFESPEELKMGDLVELEVDLRDTKAPVKVIGEIRWITESKNVRNNAKAYINGVKLINIPASDEGRFLKYYCEKVVEKLSYYLKM